uniref:G-protein coupled receptors family 1 profile domain-containing protein n=1 Tax=Latimeria chalumnae TaxID=7897 RepID=H3A855_LATCH
IYTIAMLVGLPANGLSLWILFTRTKRLTSTIFLINLAVADLLFTYTLPFKISYHFWGNDWCLGEYACRILVAAFYGNIYCSVLLLMCISVDRYIALVHPLFAKTLRSKGLSIKICLAVWIIIIIAMIPFTVIHQTYSLEALNITTCHDVQPRNAGFGSPSLPYYFVILVVLGFLLPFSVITFCYISVLRILMSHKEKYNRAIRLTVLVLVMFTVCFAPSNVILLIHNLELLSVNHDGLYTSYMVCLALSSLNTCIDPFIYYYVSVDFRSHVKNSLWFSKLSVFKPPMPLLKEVWLPFLDAQLSKQDTKNNSASLVLENTF